MIWERRGRMDCANLGRPCMLVRPLTNQQSKEWLRIPYCYRAQNLSLCLQTHLLPCDLCNTRFTSSQALQLHLEENHLDMTMDCQEESGMAINAIFNLFPFRKSVLRNSIQSKFESNSVQYTLGFAAMGLAANLDIETATSLTDLLPHCILATMDITISNFCTYNFLHLCIVK